MVLRGVRVTWRENKGGECWMGLYVQRERYMCMCEPGRYKASLACILSIFFLAWGCSWTSCTLVWLLPCEKESPPGLGSLAL